VGIIPLAAWATRPGFRIAVIIVTIVVGVFGPTANGDRFALFRSWMPPWPSTIIVALLIAVTYRRLPWRPLPNEELTSDAAGQDPLPTSQTRQATPVPGAYAESS